MRFLFITTSITYLGTSLIIKEARKMIAKQRKDSFVIEGHNAIDEHKSIAKMESAKVLWYL